MNERKGILVYLDEAKRKFAESALEEIEVTDWHPSNTATIHLWRCFEALKDIDNLLQGSTIIIAQEERRRRVKILVTPLYSLCIAIQDICNYLSSTAELKSQFNKKERAKIAKLLSEFLTVVPLDKTSAIRGVRDQLSAHIDKLMPNEAKTIFAKAQTHQIGIWLHQCIVTLSKVLLLEVFAWTTDDCPEGYLRLMNVEPWLVTFKLDNDKPVEITGLHVTKSPKKLIVEIYDKIIQTSEWMFRPEDLRIVPFKEESIDT